MTRDSLLEHMIWAQWGALVLVVTLLLLFWRHDTVQDQTLSWRIVEVCEAVQDLQMRVIAAQKLKCPQRPDFPEPLLE